MALGPSHPIWRQLYEELAKLAVDCGGEHAFVIDEGNGLWCLAIPHIEPTGSTRGQDRAADRFYKAEIVPRMTAMRRGKRIRLAVTEGDDRYAAISFAAIYMTVVWFGKPFTPDVVHAKIDDARSEIERLTLLLPPSGGPGFDEGAAKLRA